MIIYWVILDPDTNEMLVRCTTRQQARDLTQGIRAKIAKVVLVD